MGHNRLAEFLMGFQQLRRDGGGAEGIRTPGLLIANEALSQLSYSPVPPCAGPVAERGTVAGRGTCAADLAKSSRASAQSGERSKVRALP